MKYEIIKQSALQNRSPAQLLQHMQIAKRVEHYKQMEQGLLNNKVVRLVETGQLFRGNVKSRD